MVMAALVDDPDQPVAIVVLRGPDGMPAELSGRRICIWEEMPGRGQIPRELREGDLVVGDLKPSHQQSLKERGVAVARLKFEMVE